MSVEENPQALALELRQDLLGQRRIEVLRDDELPLLRSQNALARRWTDRHKTRDGPTRPGDQDILSSGYTLEQPREVRLGLMDVDSLQVIYFELSP